MLSPFHRQGNRGPHRRHLSLRVTAELGLNPQVFLVSNAMLLASGLAPGSLSPTLCFLGGAIHPSPSPEILPPAQPSVGLCPPSLGRDGIQGLAAPSHPLVTLAQPSSFVPNPLPSFHRSGGMGKWGGRVGENDTHLLWLHCLSPFESGISSAFPLALGPPHTPPGSPTVEEPSKS